MGGGVQVPGGGAHRRLARASLAGRSLGQPDMLGVGLKARLQRVRPADLLEPGWDPLVVQVRMITTVAADDLEQAGAADLATICDPGRLPPQAGCPAMAGLASMRE